MQCPKCFQVSPDQAQFCIRCHAPLKFICPACKHAQAQGGKCERCGVDFAKYGAMLVFKAKDDASLGRARARSRAGIIKQILLLPVTGGLSLLKYLRSRLSGD